MGWTPAARMACWPLWRSLARRFGIPAQLSWEAYMRCGMGFCGSCEHEGRLLCLDGPVSNANLSRRCSYAPRLNNSLAPSILKDASPDQFDKPKVHTDQD